MDPILAYLLLLVLTVVFLTTDTARTAPVAGASADSLLLMEQMTIHTSKPKNYRRQPENHQAFGYFVRGFPFGEEAVLEYVFPIIYKHEARFRTQVHARNVSSAIGLFGAHESCVVKANESQFRLATGDFGYLKQHMNREGFFFRSEPDLDWGMDYDHIIRISSDLTLRIAQFIVAELHKIRQDSYVTRVTAALSFVQFIPYGVPDFDHGEYSYMGLALPHESVIISYSDCDSKSCLFAGILSHLIQPGNVVLVSCEAEGGGGHMLAAVAGLPFGGQTVMHEGRSFMLLETTTPIPMEQQGGQSLTNIQIHPLAT